MLNHTQKLLAGMLSYCVLGTTIARADVQIAVAHIFQPALTTIIGDFVNDNPQYLDVTFTLTPGSSGGLYSTINSALGGGGESPYNMFFAADSYYPALLNSNWSSTVGTPFQYAQGSLMLVSNGVVTVTSGLPSTYGNTGIANANGTIPPVIPTGAPYGDAALNVLQNTYSIPSTSSTINASFTSPGAVLTAVGALSINTGFVAKTQICNTTNGTIQPSKIGNAATPTYHEFTPGSGYTASVLLQSGNVIARSSSSSHEDDAVADLATYMSSSTAQTDIQNYCFSVPTTKLTAAKSYESIKEKMKTMIRKPTKAIIKIIPGI
jgi:molybdate transport system substrate-binding protein